MKSVSVLLGVSPGYPAERFARYLCLNQGVWKMPSAISIPAPTPRPIVPARIVLTLVARKRSPLPTIIAMRGVFTTSKRENKRASTTKRTNRRWRLRIFQARGNEQQAKRKNRPVLTNVVRKKSRVGMAQYRANE